MPARISFKAKRCEIRSSTGSIPQTQDRPTLAANPRKRYRNRRSGVLPRTHRRRKPRCAPGAKFEQTKGYGSRDEKSNSLLHDTRRGCGDNHRIGSTAARHLHDTCKQAGSRGSNAAAAPSRIASSRRKGIVSVASIVAPERFTSMVNIRPMGPCPRITTTSSGCGSSCTTPFRHVFTGSTKQPDRTRRLREFFPLRAARSNPSCGHIEKIRRPRAHIPPSRLLSYKPGIARTVCGGSKNIRDRGCGGRQ